MISLVTTAALIRAKETALFEDKTDSDLILVKQTQSLIDMTYDLQNLYNLQESDLTTIINDNLDYFKELLALKQIALFLLETDAPEGSMNWVKMNYYKKLYSERLQGAKNFSIGETIPSLSSVRILR